MRYRNDRLQHLVGDTAPRHGQDPDGSGQVGHALRRGTVVPPVAAMAETAMPRLLEILLSGTRDGRPGPVDVTPASPEGVNYCNNVGLFCEMYNAPRNMGEVQPRIAWQGMQA